MSGLTRSPTRLSARTVDKRRRDFLWAGSGWDLYFVSAILLGILLQLIFDGIVDDRSLAYLLVVIGVYGAVELGRRMVVHRAAISWVRVWTMTEMFLRGGMLRSQVASGGRHAGRPVDHAGAAMTRFRDDPRDVAWYVDSWIDVAGAGLYALIAIAIMASIDPWLTLVSILPVLAVVVTTRMLGGLVSRAHRRHLEATSELTAALRDAFAAHDTIRLYGARDGVTAEVAARSRRRSRAAVVDRVLTESIRAASNSLAGVAIGIMLLVAADDLRSGALSIGDLALFTAYLRYMTFLPRMVGHFLTRHRQAAVGFERMGELAAEAEPANLLVDLDLDIDRLADPWEPPGTDRVRLQRLEVRGLRSLHQDGGGVQRADLTVDRGTLTVITGAVGSGKTTLARAIVGLTPAAGELRWNGELVTEPASFMVPPNAAYLAQSPKLFSDTVAANIELGAVGAGADAAVTAAGLADEIDAMAAGTATLVGPRGVRLSGGQRQRLGLARALHRQPELLVLDDLSSAVDADTEVALWQRLRASGATVIAISNRPIAAAAADQVLVMRDGVLSER